MEVVALVPVALVKFKLEKVEVPPVKQLPSTDRQPPVIARPPAKVEVAVEVETKTGAVTVA